MTHHFVTVVSLAEVADPAGAVAELRAWLLATGVGEEVSPDAPWAGEIELAEGPNWRTAVDNSGGYDLSEQRTGGRRAGSR